MLSSNGRVMVAMFSALGSFRRCKIPQGPYERISKGANPNAMRVAARPEWAPAFIEFVYTTCIDHVRARLGPRNFGDTSSESTGVWTGPSGQTHGLPTQANRGKSTAGASFCDIEVAVRPNFRSPDSRRFRLCCSRSWI